MKTGIELIADERQKQLVKYPVVRDMKYNSTFDRPLTKAASALTIEHGFLATQFMKPDNWDEQQWLEMMAKPYKERLIIAGALIAAEIDRVIVTEE